MTEMQKEKCHKIAEHYREDYQYLKAVEEMAELTQLIVKGVNGDLDVIDKDYLSELADVCIMVEQLRWYCEKYGGYCALQATIERKLERQFERMESETQAQT